MCDFGAPVCIKPNDFKKSGICKSCYCWSYNHTANYTPAQNIKYLKKIDLAQVRAERQFSRRRQRKSA